MWCARARCVGGVLLCWRWDYGVNPSLNRLGWLVPINDDISITKLRLWNVHTVFKQKIDEVDQRRLHILSRFLNCLSVAVTTRHLQDFYKEVGLAGVIPLTEVNNLVRACG